MRSSCTFVRGFRFAKYSKPIRAETGEPSVESGNYYEGMSTQIQPNRKFVAHDEKSFLVCFDLEVLFRFANYSTFGFVSFWFRFALISFRFVFVSFWFRFAEYSKPVLFGCLIFKSPSQYLHTQE